MRKIDQLSGRCVQMYEIINICQVQEKLAFSMNEHEYDEIIGRAYIFASREVGPLNALKSLSVVLASKFALG